MPTDFNGSLPGSNPLFEIQTEFETRISPYYLHEFLESTFANNKVKQSAVKIQKDNYGEISFIGTPLAGFEADEEKVLRLLNEALHSDLKNVRMPARKTYSRVVIDPDLEARGVKEIIAIGQSNFAGSADTRKQNISTAAKKFNGKIIKKGNQFSFNRILESVSKKNGFVEELVIKGVNLEKEYGGGVCQVSTTAFRAAFNGGHPITVRKNHSYTVPYYKPVGLDATIYLNGQDFRFLNDTPGDILIQTFIEGNNLFFVFYGTRDDRKVVMEGPFISDIKEAPEDPIIIETSELPLGEEEEISGAHDGLRAEWIRKTKKNGKWKKENFVSLYQPWAAKILMGTALFLAEEKENVEPEIITPLKKLAKSKSKKRSSDYGKRPPRKNTFEKRFPSKKKVATDEF